MITSQKKERKDHVVSLRISSKLKDFLMKDSRKKRIPLGVNIERILEEQQKWENFSRQIMLIETSREVFSELCSITSDKKLKDLAKNKLAPFLESSIIFEHGKLTLENLFSIYERWIDYNMMHSRHIENEDGHRFVFKHQLGQSFALMNFEACKELTVKLDYKITPVEISDSLLVFDVKNPKKQN